MNLMGNLSKVMLTILEFPEIRTISLQELESEKLAMVFVLTLVTLGKLHSRTLTFGLEKLLDLMTPLDSSA